MAYLTLPHIRHFLHTVCANVLRLPPVACRIVQHSFGSMVRTRIGMLESMVFRSGGRCHSTYFPDLLLCYDHK